MTQENTPATGSRFGIISVILIFIPILMIVIMNVIVYPLTGKLPTGLERILFVLLAFLPALIGFIFAIMGLVKKEQRKWLHGIGLIFNLLQALYFGLFALFAG
jgi:hypothetical protein